MDDVLSVKSHGENRQHQMQFKDFGFGSKLIRVLRSLCTHDGIEAALKWQTHISTDGVVRLHPETQVGHFESVAYCVGLFLPHLDRALLQAYATMKGKGFPPKATSTCTGARFVWC